MPKVSRKQVAKQIRTRNRGMLSIPLNKDGSISSSTPILSRSRQGGITFYKPSVSGRVKSHLSMERMSLTKSEMTQRLKDLKTEYETEIKAIESHLSTM